MEIRTEVRTQGKRQVLLPIFIFVCHLHQDFLYVLVSGFHCTSHLRAIRNQIFVLNLELLAKLLDHFPV